MSACIQILSAIGPLASASERWTRGLTGESMLPALAISSRKLRKYEYIQSDFTQLNNVKITMKTSILTMAIVVCALSAPIISARENSGPAGSAKNMDMDKQMSQMQENMKEMQQQMAKIRATSDP